MKYLVKLFTVAFIMTASTQLVNAQSKVAHIDVQKLITDMPEVITAQKELEKLQKTYSTDIQNTVKEFQVKQQTYSADAANQTDITNQARAEELQAMQQNIQKFEQTAAQDLQKKQTKIYNSIKVLLFPPISPLRGGPILPLRDGPLDCASQI